MISFWGNIFLWTGISIFLFQLFVKFTKWQTFRKFPPLIFTTIILIFILKKWDISYDTYLTGVSPISFLLTPATIALAYPLYKNMHIIRQNKVVVSFGVLTATLVSLFSAWGIAHLFKASYEMNASISLKSVTMPVAVKISEIIGGIPPITACMVVFTGLWGGILGHAILSFLGIRHSLSVGLAIGGSSHVFGTAQCLAKGKMEEAAVSVFTLVAVAICTAFVAPLLFFQGW